MTVSESAAIALLGLIATVNVAQFAHQLRFSRVIARHRARPAEEAHGNR